MTVINSMNRRTANFAAQKPKAKPAAAVIKYEEKALTSEKKMFEGLSDLFDDSDVSIDELRQMVEREPQVKAAVELKVLARVSTGWDIEAASEDQADIEIRDFVADQLESMDGTVDAFIRRAMNAMVYRLSVHEVVYKPVEGGRWNGKTGLKALKVKKADTFRIKTDEFGNLDSLMQKQGMNDEKALPLEYFIFWAWNHEGDYKGKSDLRAAYRWYKAKDFISRFWNLFLEKFSTPTPVGISPRGTSKIDSDRVLKFLANIHNEGAVVVPEGWVIEFIESVRTGGDFKEALEYCDKMITRSMLLPNLLLDEGKSGSYSLGKSHSNTFAWVMGALATEIQDSLMGEQQIKRLVDWNYPNVDKYPKFKFKPFDMDNFEEMVSGLCDLMDRGVIDATEPFIRQKLGLPAKVEVKDAPKAPVKNEPAPKIEEDPSTEFSEDQGAANFSESGLKHSRKCDFARYEATLDSLERDAIRGMATGAQKMHRDLLRKIKSGKIVENRKTAAVDKLRINAPREMRLALETGFGHAIRFGSSDALAEVNRGLTATGGSALRDLGASTGNNFDDGETHDFDMGEVIAAWDKRVPIQRTMLTHYSREAYTVTGVMRDDLLRKSKQQIRAGIIRGASYKDIERAINDVFEPYYLNEVDPVVGTAHRLENIVRTNMSSAYNTGRMNFYNHPDVRGFIRAFEYSAVMDRRTTEVCAAWHGTVLKSDDSRVSTMTPSNHFRCRSVWIPVVQGEAHELTANPSGVQPATGFRL